PPEPVVERHEVAFVCSKFAIEPKAPPRTGHYTLAVLALHGRNRPIHLSMGWHAFCRYAPEPGGRFPLLRRTGSRHGHPGRAAADAYPGGGPAPPPGGVDRRLVATPTPDGGRRRGARPSRARLPPGRSNAGA